MEEGVGARVPRQAVAQRRLREQGVGARVPRQAVAQRRLLTRRRRAHKNIAAGGQPPLHHIYEDIFYFLSSTLISLGMSSPNFASTVASLTFFGETNINPIACCPRFGTHLKTTHL